MILVKVVTMPFISSKWSVNKAIIFTISICLNWASISRSADARDVITGADISQAIVETLEMEGEQATPQIVAAKKFYPCDSPLEITPMFGGWKTVRVICAAPIPWKITVRAQWPTTGRKILKAKPASAKQEPKAKIIKVIARPVAMEFDVVALTRSVRKGDILTAEDVVLMSVHESKARGAVENLKHAIGRKVRQSLSSRKVLKPRHLEKNWLIEKDDILTMRVNHNGIEVLGVGIAQEPGQFGEIIRMRNSSSGVLLRVKVTGNKNVDVISKTSR
jgi:flagella basal body P-ring formation protein FlgA